jgi:hypothetical protein
LPLKFNLQLKSDDGNSEVSGEFTDEESERLQLFVQYVDEVSNTRLVQNADWGTAKIQYDEGIGQSYKATLPPWEDVIVFLHKSRPLFLKNEVTYFYDIQSLLGRALDHPVIRGILRAQSKLYSGKSFQEQVKLVSNDVILNSEKVLFKWLNAYEYHREKEYREFIDGLHSMLPLEISKVFFLGLLHDKAKAAFGLADLIQVIQGIQQRLSFGGDD